MTQRPRDLPPYPAESGQNPDRLPLTETIYQDIRRIARAKMRRESPHHTLCATDLTHIVLSRVLDAKWSAEDRQDLLRRVGTAMRHYLIDHARKKIARSEKAKRIDLTETATTQESDAAVILAVAAAMKSLRASLPRVAQVVELRWFAGMEYAEISTALGISIRTVGNDWSLARAWLRNELAMQACA